MLDNKKLNMLISLLIAAALWTFVIGEVNPQASRVYREIPITFLNEDTIESSGMAIYAISNRTMNVTLTGTRSEVNQVSEKDISATVDLDEAIAYGENQLKVTLKVPQKVDIENQSLEYITVSLDQWTSKDVQIRIQYEGEYEKDKEPITIEQSIEEVTVSGADISVSRIEAVEAVVDADQVSTETGHLEIPLVPVDKNGQQVYGVELASETLFLTTELAKEKTVPLEVPVLNEEDGAVERVVTMPEKITIKGLSKNIEEIDKVVAEEIDISKVKESTSIDIKPILPEGVEVSAKSKSLTLSVEVIKNSTKTIEFDEEAFTVEGLGDGLTAEIKQNSISLALTAQETILRNIQKEDLQIILRLDGLRVGEHKVEPVVSLEGESVDDDAVQLQIKPNTVTVVIEEEAEAAEKSEDGSAALEETSEDSETEMQSETEDNATETATDADEG